MRFPLRINDDNLWARFGRWCDEQGVSMNTGLLLLVRAAVDGKIKIGAHRA
jgi:hypothetical protein